MRTVIAVLVCLGLAAQSADACVIDSTSSVSFGTYNVFSATPLDSTGSVSYVCVVSLSIRIDLSTGGSGTYAARKLAGPGGDKLAYQLYLDAARTRVWGDGNSSERYGPFIGLLVVTSIPIYGRVFAKQDVRAGAYTDSVTVTLNY